MSDFPNYERPPVVEVACGFQYAPLGDMHSAHVGRYWATIQDQFPLTEELPPLAYFLAAARAGEATEPPPELLSQFPWPLTRFLEGTKHRLIQLQRDRFMFNWRKLSTEDEYPRYRAISKDFFTHWKGFLAFLDSLGLRSPVPDLCELTYVNVLPKGEGWDLPVQVRDLFVFIDWPEQAGFLPPPADTRCILSFDMPNNIGRLYADLSHSRWTVTGDLPVLRLVLTARGRPAMNVSDQSLAEWFDIAHEWIVKGFTELVDPRTDSLWGRVR